MKKISCLVLMLLVTQGTVLSMMLGRKMVNKTSFLKSGRKITFDPVGDGTLIETYVAAGPCHVAGLRDRESNENRSTEKIDFFEKIDISLKNIESKLEEHDKLLQGLSNDSMTIQDRNRIAQARVSSIYKVAQIEAMCKIYTTPNLDYNVRKHLLERVPYIVKE